MSQPARRFEPAERRTPPRASAPSSAPPLPVPLPVDVGRGRSRPPCRPAAARRSRPSHRRSIGFVLLASTVVGSMVFGIVVVNVLLAQTSFRIGEAERRLEELSEDNLELVREQATPVRSGPDLRLGQPARHASPRRHPHPPCARFGLGEPAGADPSSERRTPTGRELGSEGDPPT